MKRSTRQTLADVAVMAQHATVLVGPVVGVRRGARRADLAGAAMSVAPILPGAPCPCACHRPGFHVAHVAPCCNEETYQATEEFWRDRQEGEGHRDG